MGSEVGFQDEDCVTVDTGQDVVNRKAARSSGRSAAERNAIVIDRFFEKKQGAGLGKSQSAFYGDASLHTRHLGPAAREITSILPLRFCEAKNHALRLDTISVERIK